MEDFNITQRETNNKDLNTVKEVIGNQNVPFERKIIPQLSWLIPDNAGDFSHNLMFILISHGKQLTTYYRSQTIFYFCMHTLI